MAMTTTSPSRDALPARSAPLSRAARRRSLEARRRRFLRLLLVPTVLFAALVIVYPLYLVGDASVHNVDILSVGALNSGPTTTANYRALGSDSSFTQALRVTLVYTVTTTLLSFLIGLGLALLLNLRFPGRSFFRKVVLLPWAVPAVVAGYLFVWMFNASYGVVDYLLVHLHLTRTYLPWLASDQWALVAVIATTTWKFYPLFCLLILAGLQVVPHEYYEAAQLDGAGMANRFRHITWPAIRPVAFFSLVLGCFGIFGEFAIIYPMTDGGPGGSTQTLGIYMYNQAFQLFHMGYSSTLGMVMFAISIALVFVCYPRLRRTLWR